MIKLEQRQVTLFWCLSLTLNLVNKIYSIFIANFEHVSLSCESTVYKECNVISHLLYCFFQVISKAAFALIYVLMVYILIYILIHAFNV